MSVVVAPTETRPGWKTTEFWLTALLLLGGVVQQAVGVFNIPDKTVLQVQFVLAAAYTIARGLAKVGVPNVPAVVEGDPADTRAHGEAGYVEGGLLGILLAVCVIVLLVVLIGHLPLWLLLIIVLVVILGAVA